MLAIQIAYQPAQLGEHNKAEFGGNPPSLRAARLGLEVHQYRSSDAVWIVRDGRYSANRTMKPH
jgi:hypothetical protein